MKNNMFGQNLRQLRTEAKISQRKFGELFGVVNQTVSFWETGAREPDFDTLIKISLYFKVSVGYLLGIEEF